MAASAAVEEQWRSINIMKIISVAGISLKANNGGNNGIGSVMWRRHQRRQLASSKA